MKLSEIAETHPIIFDLVQQLLAKGKMVMLRVMNGTYPHSLGIITELTYEDDVDDYEFKYRNSGSGRLNTYFTPASHLETFTLRKQPEVPGKPECWVVDGEWEQPKKVAEGRTDEPLIYLLLKQRMAKGEVMINNMGPSTVVDASFKMDPKVDRPFIAVTVENEIGRLSVLRFYGHEWDDMTLREVGEHWWLAYEPED